MKWIFNSLSLSKEWFIFSKQNYAHIIFIPLFYSLQICYSYISNYDLSLHGFPERMIGIATLNGVDIAKRVSLFYNSIFLFLAINGIFYMVVFLVTRRKKYILKDLSIINISSVAGCLLIFLKVFKLNGSDGIYLIILLHLTSIVFLAVRKIFLADSNKKLFNPTVFSSIVCISISFFFLSKELASLFHFTLYISFSACVLIYSSMLFLGIAIYARKHTYFETLHFSTKFFWVLMPVMLFPLFTSLKNEIYLILNNKGILYFTPFKLYLILVFFTSVWVYIRSRKHFQALSRISANRVLVHYLFPLLILGITTFIYYSPFIETDSNGRFEDANRVLPVMELLKFHTVPLLEKFNSHMFSEIFSVYLYSIFNKLHGFEPYIYDFIFPVSLALTGYFIIKDLTHNAYVALFTVLLFPLANDLTTGFFPTLLAVYILYKIVYLPPSFKKYLLLFCSGLFFMCWKIDIGVGVIFSMLAIFILYAWSKIMKVNYKFLLKALGLIVSITLLVYFLFLAHGINLIRNFMNEFNYLSSSQSYGYSTLGNGELDKVFRMQYFIFPVLALLLGGYILFHFKKFSTSKNLKFATVCLLFSIGFYISNFQRGLVRHGFIEGTDEYLSSFIFFILSGSVYLLCRHQSHTIKFLLFFFVSFLLITGFKYPDSHPFVVYESFKSSLKNFTQLQLHAAISREISSVPPEKNFMEFRNFVSKELRNDETFIDFSNEPILYYYTQKITPSYFYQNPVSLHNDYLQEEFIKNLSKYKAPLLIFSNTLPYTPTEWFWNNTDGVPNALRHYRIAEYLYREYQPFACMENLCLWKKKGSELKNNCIHLFTYVQQSLSYENTIQNKALDSISTTGEGNIFITISTEKPVVKEFGLMYSKGNDNGFHGMEAVFSDTAARKSYYLLKHKGGERIKFYANHFENISGIQIDEMEYMPDIYSGVPQYWKMAYLPYIWANNDKKIASAAVQNIIANTDTLIDKSRISFALPSNIDKSSGNYIFITLDAVNENPVTVQLAYGPSNGTIDFTIPPGAGIRTFAVRISSQYNWYARENKSISLFAPSAERIHLKKIALLKGD